MILSNNWPLLTYISHVLLLLLLLLLCGMHLIANMCLWLLLLLLWMSVDVVLRRQFNVLHLHWLLNVLRGRVDVHVLNWLTARMVLLLPTVVGVIWMHRVVWIIRMWHLQNLKQIYNI